MKRQINMVQMKEKINKMEINNLSDAEFKILVIRMLKELREREEDKISDLEDKEAEKTQSGQKKKKCE